MTRPPLIVAAATLLAVLTCLSGTAAAATAAAAAAATTAPAASDPLPVAVSLTSVNPSALAPNTNLTVTGTVRNVGRTTLSSLQVVLRLDWRLLNDRHDLAEWAALDPRNPANGTKQSSVPLGRPLAPGQTLFFAVGMAGSTVQLPPDAAGFGPRGMSVEIQEGPASGGRRVGIVRTFTVWDPVRKYRPTRLALLVPITQGRQPVDPTGSGGQVPQLWQPSGRLNRVLAATNDPAFSYALDPALLTAATTSLTRQAARPRGAPDSTAAVTSPTSTAATQATSQELQGQGATGAPTAQGTASRSPAGKKNQHPTTRPTNNPFDKTVAADARTVLDQLKSATSTHQLLTLPYADPDVAALGDGYRDVLDAADAEAALVTAEILGTTLPGSLVWPMTNRIDSATASLSTIPGRRLVVSSSAVAGTTSDGTPPVHARLPMPNGAAEALITDDVLSTTLADTGGPAPILATQRLLAETAAITATHPTESPVVLATVPRDWAPDTVGVLSSLATLRAAPWLQLDRAGVALKQPAVTSGRLRLVSATTLPSTRLPDVHVQIIDRQLHLLRDFSPALNTEGQQILLRPVRRSALEMLSTAWISRQKGVGPARSILTTEVNNIYQGVTVIAGSSANLLARSGQLPITVDNKLQVPVTVILRLHPTSGRVVVKRPVRVDLEPFKSQTVRAQLAAVANGEVQIESVLTTPVDGGTVIGTASPITVRVHYDWENRGLLWVAGLLGLLLVGGLVRSVRRGRVRVLPENVPDPDDIGRDLTHRTAGTGSPDTTRTSSAGPAGPADEAQPAAEGGTGSAGLVSNSAIMAAGTFASRVLGVVRTVVLAWAIGQQGLSADAFATANTLPNSLMILIAGGVLNAVLVPQIVRAAQRPDGGRDYLDRLLTLAILVLGGATVLATASAPALVWLYGGAKWPPAQVELATEFAVWCLPQIFFYGLYTIYGQVLNARGSFGPYMWAPVVNNIVAIAGTLVFVAVCGAGRQPPQWWGAGSVAILAGTATLGIVAQALVLLPAMRRSGYRWRPRWGWRGIGLRTAGRIAGWTFAAAAAGQLMFVFISRAANQAGALGAARGSVVAGRFVYDNAYLLFILPHSLVAVSLVTAVFTRMSVSASADRTDDVRADASLAVRLTGVATVLATVAMIVLSRDLTRTIWVGNSRADTDALALTTACMAVGLVPFSAQYLFSRVFYAYEDARTPFWIQVATVSIWAGGSTVCAAVLRPEWIVPGIGLSMSLSSLVGAGLSVAILRRRLGGLDGTTLARTHGRLVTAAVAAGLLGWLVSTGLHLAAGPGLVGSGLALTAAAVTMIVGYGVLLRVMRVEELDLVLAPLKSRLGRGG
jgi:putative peptidoglycan lipid II flippase